MKTQGICPKSSTIIKRNYSSASLVSACLWVCFQVRVLIISRERAPAALLRGLEQHPASPQADPHSASVDPVVLLRHIQLESDQRVRLSDYVPLRAAAVLEPLLHLAGFGRYHLRMSSFCGYVVALVHTDRIPGVPLGRIFDLALLFAEALSFLQQLEPRPGLATANRVRALLSKCILPDAKAKYGIRFRDLFAAVTDIDWASSHERAASADAFQVWFRVCVTMNISMVMVSRRVKRST